MREPFKSLDLSPINPTSTASHLTGGTNLQQPLLSVYYRRARGNYAGFFFGFLLGAFKETLSTKTFSSSYYRDEPSKIFTEGTKYRISQTQSSENSRGRWETQK
jgi:hypothetical protein